MKTTLTKTRIMILLAVFLAAPLLANLPCVTGTCTGEGSCRICGEGKTGASGKVLDAIFFVRFSRHAECPLFSSVREGARPPAVAGA